LDDVGLAGKTPKMLSRTPNGRLEAEVIANFGDGQAYSKNRMEEALTSGILEKPLQIQDTSAFKPKTADVDLIVSELEIPRVKAEKALAASKGDIVEALKSLVTPSS